MSDNQKKRFSDMFAFRKTSYNAIEVIAEPKEALGLWLSLAFDAVTQVDRMYGEVDVDTLLEEPLRAVVINEKDYEGYLESFVKEDSDEVTV